MSCTSEGGGTIVIDGISHDDWGHGVARCQGRVVELLKRDVGTAGGHVTWEIVDALLLPPLETGRKVNRPNGPRFADANQCELKGRPNTYFIAQVRWGKRELIDWRTGVERAWSFDVERGRIVPLSTRGIVCERFTP